MKIHAIRLICIFSVIAANNVLAAGPAKTADDYKAEFLQNKMARMTVSVCISNPNDERPDSLAKCAGARAALKEQFAAEQAAKKKAEQVSN